MAGKVVTLQSNDGTVTYGEIELGEGYVYPGQPSVIVWEGKVFIASPSYGPSGDGNFYQRKDAVFLR